MVCLKSTSGLPCTIFTWSSLEYLGPDILHGLKPPGNLMIQLELNYKYSGDCRCVKSALIQSFSGPSFSAFGLNAERYELSLRSQSKYGKIRTRKTPNTDTSHAVNLASRVLFFSLYTNFYVIS